MYVNFKNEILGLIVNSFGTSILTYLVYLSKKIVRNKKLEQENINNLKNGIKVLLKDRIQYICNYYIEKKYFPVNCKSNVLEMYEQYKVLGGNGIVEQLISESNKLPSQS